jgi:hypothetical protein
LRLASHFKFSGTAPGEFAMVDDIHERRGRFRFSVASLLAGVAAFSLLLGWQVDRMHRQRLAVRYLDRLTSPAGAYYIYDDDVDSHLLWGRPLDLSRDLLHSLVLIEFDCVGDGDVASLPGPLGTKELRLRNCQRLTDVGLRHLVPKLPRLMGIEIDACPNITDAGFCELMRGFPNLRCVTVWECPQLTDSAFSCLASLKRLRKLRVFGNRSCNGLVATLRDARQLRDLNVNFLKFADVDFDQLRAFNFLEKLVIQLPEMVDDSQAMEFEHLRRALPRCEVIASYPSALVDPDDLFLRCKALE